MSASIGWVTLPSSRSADLSEQKNHCHISPEKNFRYGLLYGGYVLRGAQNPLVELSEWLLFGAAAWIARLSGLETVLCGQRVQPINKDGGWIPKNHMAYTLISKDHL
jgi:hypothetical protein